MSTIQSNLAPPELVTIKFKELQEFCSDDDTFSSSLLIDKIGQAFGANGLGIVVITELPDTVVAKRATVLHCAHQLGELATTQPDTLRDCIVPEAHFATGWSYGQEQLVAGVPDVCKGSFYANPVVPGDYVLALVERERKRLLYESKYNNDNDDDCHRSSSGSSEDRMKEHLIAYEARMREMAIQNPAFFAPNVYPAAALSELEPAIRDMGEWVVNTGCMVAKLCEAYCLHRHGLAVPLEATLRESLYCKARLLHYFPVANENGSSVDESTAGVERNGDSDAKDDDDNVTTWWCGWHTDHGSLTGLVPAMYMDATRGQEIICDTTSTAGLYIRTRRGKTVSIPWPSTASTNSLAFQVGETFQILSGGCLQATPHAVRAPAKEHGVMTTAMTRETMAVFLQPDFDFPMEPPPGKDLADCWGDESFLPDTVCSLSQRYRRTFGAFHNATIQAFAKKPSSPTTKTTKMP